MVQAFQEGRDLYATLGTGVWNNDYWDNMEHYEDGSSNVEGKARRKKCKTLLLGLSYGMGDALTAQKMGVSTKEAKDIIKKFFASYPKMKEFVDNNELLAQKQGYVEDAWGRKRRLPDATLPDYDFIVEKYRKDFNPILDSCGDVHTDNSKVYADYLRKLNACRRASDRQPIKEDALKHGIKIRDNGAFISRAARQSTNARIQGSAATMTKKAMINIYHDEVMNSLGFKLLIAVHDELIGECPIENSEKCAERLSYLMSTCVKDTVYNVPFKTDAEVEDVWYFNSYSHQIQKEYNDYIKSGMDEDIAFKKLCAEHEECLPDRLTEALNNVEG